MERSRFYDTLRARKSTMFGTSLSGGQVFTLESFIDEGNARGTPLCHLAYIMATVRAECGSAMAPVREGFAKTDAGARRAVRGRKYGKPAGPYNHVYYGRGYVQLTWLDNYEFATKKLGIDVVKNPDRVLDATTARLILFTGMTQGWFTQKALGDFIFGDRIDYRNARKIINGLDRAAEIKGFAEEFEDALRAGGYTAQAPKREPVQPVPPLPAPTPPAKPVVVPVEAPVVQEPVLVPATPSSAKNGWIVLLVAGASAVLAWLGFGG